LEQPGNERGGGAFAVGAGHHDALPLPHQKAVQGLGQGQPGEIPGQDLLGLGILPADDVAHHHQVRLGLQVPGLITIHHLDPQPFQKSAHGRIDLFIRAGDPKTLLLQDARQCGHTRAADAKEVDVLHLILLNFFHRRDAEVAEKRRG